MTLVFSAKSVESELDVIFNVKSNEKSSGHETDLCGTPCFVLSQTSEVPLIVLVYISTLCFMLDG